MLLQFSRLNSCPDLVHAVTTARFNGSMNFNLADHVGLGTDNAINHRRLLMEHLSLPFERLTVAQQVHECHVAVVTDENAGRGHGGWASGIPQTDAMITRLARTPVMVLSADCPLLLVHDPANKAVGVIHASWRCTFGGIIGRTVEAMVTHFGSRPEELLAGIGPGAGPCCYEVDDKFIDTIGRRPELLPFVLQRGTQRLYDLWSAGESELVRAGLRADRIEKMGRCSICDEQFFSFRRQDKQAGRFGLIAALT